MFQLGQNLFNEKELHGRDGSVPRSGLPEAWVFRWTVQFCSGFDVLFYIHLKCFGLFVSEAFKFKFSAWQFNIQLLSVSVLNANLSHILSGHISSEICQSRE